MKPKIVASECCAGRHPKNTLQGFKFCLDSKVDGIEFDVHLSADGQVVVQHDYRLNSRITRDASGHWLKQHGPPIGELTLAQLQRFDVGRYAPGSREEQDYPNYQPVDGEQIPTLEALLQAHQAAGSNTELWIELKTTPFDRGVSSDPDQLLASVLSLVSKYGVAEKTILLAFEWRLLLDASVACPGIGTDFLTINPAFIRKLYKRQSSIAPEAMYLPLTPTQGKGGIPSAISAVGGGWWGPYIADVTAEEIDFAHGNGLRVNVWGVESNAEGIERALGLGADAITISDSAMLQRRLA